MHCPLFVVVKVTAPWSWVYQCALKHHCPDWWQCPETLFPFWGVHSETLFPFRGVHSETLFLLWGVHEKPSILFQGCIQKPSFLLEGVSHSVEFRLIFVVKLFPRSPLHSPFNHLFSLLSTIASCPFLFSLHPFHTSMYITFLLTCHLSSHLFFKVGTTAPSVLFFWEIQVECKLSCDSLPSLKYISRIVKPGHASVNRESNSKNAVSHVYYTLCLTAFIPCRQQALRCGYICSYDCMLFTVQDYMWTFYFVCVFVLCVRCCESDCICKCPVCYVVRIEHCDWGVTPCSFVC